MLFHTYKFFSCYQQLRVHVYSQGLPLVLPYIKPTLTYMHILPTFSADAGCSVCPYFGCNMSPKLHYLLCYVSFGLAGFSHNHKFHAFQGFVRPDITTNDHACFKWSIYRLPIQNNIIKISESFLVSWLKLSKLILRITLQNQQCPKRH